MLGPRSCPAHARFEPFGCGFEFLIFEKNVTRWRENWYSRVQGHKHMSSLLFVPGFFVRAIRDYVQGGRFSVPFRHLSFVVDFKGCFYIVSGKCWTVGCI